MARSFDSASSQHLISTTVLDFNVSFWFKLTDFSVDRPLVSVYATGGIGGSDRYTVFARQSDSKVVLGTYTFGAAPLEIASGTTISADTWHHCYASASGGTLFIDGVEATGSVQAASALNRTAIGRYYGIGNPGWMHGQVAEVAFWKWDLYFYDTTDPLWLYSARINAHMANRYNSTEEQYPLRTYLPLIHDDKDIVGKVAFTASGGPTWADHYKVCDEFEADD